MKKPTLVSVCPGGVLQLGDVSLDGTKPVLSETEGIHANASKHKALSWRYANRLEEQLRVEVDALLKKAEEADYAEPVPRLGAPGAAALSGGREKHLRSNRDSDLAAEMSARALSGGRRDPARSRGQARPRTLCPASHRRDGRGRRGLVHDPVKWEPVFGKDHAQAKC